MGELGATLAERATWLRANFPDPETGRPHEIKAISAATDISVSQLYKILGGEAPNPGWRHLSALARFFRVPLAVFGDDEHGEQIRAQLKTLVGLRALKESGVESVSLRGLDTAYGDRVQTQLATLTGPRDHASGRDAISLEGLSPAQADRVQGIVDDLRSANSTISSDDDLDER